jgi:hypothetical protein
MKTHAEALGQPMSAGGSPRLACEQPGSAVAQLRLAFGLLLDVDPRIPLASLAPAGRATGRESATSVKIDPKGLAQRWSALRAPPRRARELRGPDGTVLLTVDFADPAGYLLWATGVGRVLIAPDGRELLCDPEPESSGWSAILPAQALPLAATLRGFEILHAAGVVLRGRAVLLAGEPAAGKTSLAAALLLRGASLLSDDAVALENRSDSLTAHPGCAELHLRPSEHERLSPGEREALGPFTALAGRQRCTPDSLSSPTPFGDLFLLERSALEPAVELLDPIDPFALLATTFNLSVRTPERLARHLDLVAALAATGRIYRLRVGPGLDATRLAELVDRHLSAQSP